jgi:protein-disulfide isomerase
VTNARTAKSAREKAAQMRAETARRQSRRRSLLVLSAVLAVIVVAVGATVLVRIASDDKAARAAASSAPPRNLVDGGIVVGNADAKATIELYEDFQCPACKAFEDANAAQIAGWVADGTAKVVYRPVAILDHASSTEYSTRALTAVAAVVDASPTKFTAFHAKLFANQPAENTAGLDDGQLVTLAQQSGAEFTAVQSALKERRYDTWIKKLTDDFSKRGFTGTPTVVVDGTQLKDTSPAGLAAAVRKAAG